MHPNSTYHEFRLIPENPNGPDETPWAPSEPSIIELPSNVVDLDPRPKRTIETMED